MSNKHYRICSYLKSLLPGDLSFHQYNNSYNKGRWMIISNDGKTIVFLQYIHDDIKQMIQIQQDEYHKYDRCGDAILKIY